MRVLVTGAAGFVGRHLVPALAGEGHAVHALVRDASRAPAGLDVEVIERDLATLAAGADLPEVDAVVHLAQANVPFPEGAGELFRVNALSTQALLEHARRCGARRFLLASTGSVYGFGDRPFTEEDPRVGTTFYAATKVAAEALVEAYAGVLSTAVLRLFCPYGPGQTGRHVPAIVGRVREGRAVTLDEGGRPRINPILVDDVVRAIAALLPRDGHQLLNVAGDAVVSIRDLAAAAGAALGRNPVFEVGSPTAAGDLVADTTRLHEELPGLRPLASLAEGLRRMAAAST